MWSFGENWIHARFQFSSPSSHSKGSPITNSRRLSLINLTYVVTLLDDSSGLRHLSLSTNETNFSYNFSFIPTTLKQDSAIEIRFFIWNQFLCQTSHLDFSGGLKILFNFVVVFARVRSNFKFSPWTSWLWDCVLPSDWERAPMDFLSLNGRWDFLKRVFLGF